LIKCIKQKWTWIIFTCAYLQYLQYHLFIYGRPYGEKKLLKMAVFWVVASCSLVEVYWHFRGACCLHHQGDCPDDGDSKYLWNVSKFVTDYMVQQPRRQPSSYLLPWEPETSQRDYCFIECCTCSLFKNPMVIYNTGKLGQNGILKWCYSFVLLISDIWWYSVSRIEVRILLTWIPSG
jgi:hypothetical protein